MILIQTLYADVTFTLHFKIIICHYRSLVKESYAELSDGEVTITNVLTKLLRLSQLTGGFIGSDESSDAEQVSSAKLEVLEDIIDAALEENRKLVIIARFVAELDAICRLLEKKRVNYSLIISPL